MEPLRLFPVIREVDWATCNCPLSWESQGAWPCISGGGAASAGGRYLDLAVASRHVVGTDVAAFANRFVEVRSVVRSNGGDMLAAVDDFGRLRLARYPWIDATAPTLDFVGHSTSVMRAVFTSGDGFVVTIGGRDRCVLRIALFCTGLPVYCCELVRAAPAPTECCCATAPVAAAA